MTTAASKEAPAYHTVRMDAGELMAAGSVGFRRHLYALQRGLHESNGSKPDSEGREWGKHAVGAIGEAVFCKFLGVYWTQSVNVDKKTPDVFPDWQVKFRSCHTHDLIFRADDIVEHRYVLVTGQGLDFRVHGWIYGYDAKEVGVWDDKGERGSPCWWVKAKKLNRFTSVV